MKIGVVGLGKLGLPVAVALGMRGHEVCGHDLRAARMTKGPVPEVELGLRGEPFNELLADSKISFSTLEGVVGWADVVMVAVQTPHRAEFDGTHRLTHERADFIYDYLVEAVAKIAAIGRSVPVFIVSTVLPGTVSREIMPVAGSLQIAYNPSFIAMGTVIRDFLDPEFVLFGSDSPKLYAVARSVYEPVTKAPILPMSIASAEAAKVAYNSFITAKITLMNAWMEVCHHTPGANVDDVTKALSLAGRRIISPMYLKAGMGDGGGCHPRDNIALSWFTRSRGMSCDLFGALMDAREKQAEWLADQMCRYDLPKAILGTAFKRESDLEDGSPSLLVANILKERGHEVELYRHNTERLSEAKTYLIGTAHRMWRSLLYPPGSVVIDPWRMVDDQPGVVVVRLGVG